MAARSTKRWYAAERLLGSRCSLSEMISECVSLGISGGEGTSGGGSSSGGSSGGGTSGGGTFGRGVSDERGAL